MCKFNEIYAKNSNACGFFISPIDNSNIVFRVASVYGKSSGRLPASNSNFVKSYSEPAIRCDIFRKIERKSRIILVPVFEHPSKDGEGYPILYGVSMNYNFFNSSGKPVYILASGSLLPVDIPKIAYFNSVPNPTVSLANCMAVAAHAKNYSVDFHCEYRIFIIRHPKDENIIQQFHEIFRDFGTSYFSYEYGARFVDWSEIDNVKRFIKFLDEYCPVVKAQD